MGTFAYLVGVKIEDVKKKFGSKDIKLLDEIVKEDPKIVNELEDIIFNYVPEKDRISVKSKLFGLVKAKDGSGLYGEWYEYFNALFALSKYVGKDICESADILKYGSTWWETIDAQLKNINSKFTLERMAEYKKVFDTPFEENEGCTNIYERHEISAFYDDYIKIESLIDSEDEELVQFYNDFKTGLKYCKDNDVDLLTFMY